MLMQRVWGLEDLSPGTRQCNRSFSSMPRSRTVSFNVLSCRRPSGQDQRPFPMKGALLGAYLTEVILWSEGISDVSTAQWLRNFPIVGFA